uniref:ER membrane protein complex subunit 2 n=1 Tax=Oncorhynchus tshawytscha TaxID=74940 RepID=A0AAZ3PDC7_ONCTS
MASVSEMYDVTWEEMRDKLRKWREDNHRNSEQIVDVGEELINEHASKLGDDIWIIYEQVMIAALDCSRDDLAWLTEECFRMAESDRCPMREKALNEDSVHHLGELHCSGF